MRHQISHPDESSVTYLSDVRASGRYDLASADSWLQERTYDIAHHLGTPEDRWLTIGDGQGGRDAIRLKAHGAAFVLATDIDETLLIAAKARGELADYRVEDAEQLSFPDKCFDYVFCKETLQQCRRPALAIYEMLRVARKGVISIEPNDRAHSPARMTRAALRRVMGRGKTHRDAEAYGKAGNYLFPFSPRDMEKIALGLGVPQLAFRGLNDAYETGFEIQAMDSIRGRRMKRKIAFRDLLCRLGLDRPMFLMAAIFHLPVTGAARAAMEKAGWHFTDLPGNRIPQTSVSAP